MSIRYLAKRGPINTVIVDVVASYPILSFENISPNYNTNVSRSVVTKLADSPTCPSSEFSAASTLLVVAVRIKFCSRTRWKVGAVTTLAARGTPISLLYQSTTPTSALCIACTRHDCKTRNNVQIRDRMSNLVRCCWCLQCCRCR